MTKTGRQLHGQMSDEKKTNDANQNTEDDMTHCPDCGTALEKCLIQQNYAIIICPNEECGYPFNQEENINNLVYVDDSDVLEAARQRLTKK